MAEEETTTPINEEVEKQEKTAPETEKAAPKAEKAETPIKEEVIKSTEVKTENPLKEEAKQIDKKLEKLQELENKFAELNNTLLELQKEKDLEKNFKEYTAGLKIDTEAFKKAIGFESIKSVEEMKVRADAFKNILLSNGNAKLGKKITPQQETDEMVKYLETKYKK